MPGLFECCGGCCAAVIIIFIVLIIYSIIKGSMFIRVGNVYTGTGGRDAGQAGYNRNSPELDSIRRNEKVMCEKCGAWADAGDSHCTQCGSRIEK